MQPELIGLRLQRPGAGEEAVVLGERLWGWGGPRDRPSGASHISNMDTAIIALAMGGGKSVESTRPGMQPPQYILNGS